jgi:two-component system, cell cycle sensor histidine kinase and response regulator CckA
LSGLKRLDQWAGREIVALAGLGLVLIAVSLAIFRGEGRAVLLSGLVLVIAALAVFAAGQVGRASQARKEMRAFLLMADDPAACFIADAEGNLILQNSAAETRFGPDARALHEALGTRMLNPGERLLRLQRQAEAVGAATEDVLGHASVLRITMPGRDGSSGGRMTLI